jgi:hypothetical protein
MMVRNTFISVLNLMKWRMRKKLGNSEDNKAMTGFRSGEQKLVMWNKG